MKNTKIAAMAVTICGIGLICSAPSLAAWHKCERDYTEKGYGPGYNGTDSTTSCASKTQPQCAQHAVAGKTRWLIGLHCVVAEQDAHTKCDEQLSVHADLEKQTGYCNESFIIGIYNGCYFKNTSGSGWYVDGNKTQTDCDTDPA